MLCTWILVADASGAKIYSSASKIRPLNEIETHEHPEGRLHEGDLVSDAPGSDGGSMGQGRHILDGKVSAKEQEAIHFAKMLAARIDSARIKGEFDRLILIAPSAFLGLMRENLSKQVMELVTQQVNKNLLKKSADIIRGYLP